MLRVLMQITMQRLTPVTMELEVLIPADVVKAEVEKAYQNVAKRARVKGFRPGKAPRSVLTHLFAPQVQSDVTNALVQTTLPKALDEKQLTPVSQPSVEPGKVDEKAAFSYKARFEVQPEIDPATVKYEGFELVRPRAQADEKLVEEQLEQLRLRSATLVAPEPARGAQKGDVVTIDFTLSVDGKEIEGGGGKGVQLELGSGQTLPEIDAALLGKKVDDVVDTEAKFPDVHSSAELRGKAGKFHITVSDVKERKLPALDDELAKDLGQFQTLVELRADIHTKLEKALKDQAEAAMAEQVVGKLNDANPVELPPTLVEQQCRAMEQEFVQRARRMGQRISPEQGQALHAQIHADAERKVRAGLVMGAIAKKHDYKVTDEDFEKGLAELAEETGKNVAKLRVEYREQSKRAMLVGMILEDRILDLIESKATITDAPEGGAEAAKADDAEPKAEKTEKAEKKASKSKAKPEDAK
jgi:trigger factor